MTYRNGKPMSLEYEPSGPLCGRFEVDFRAINIACDRFLAGRNLATKLRFNVTPKRRARK